jgi:endonuclease/exonuclease/phosphatase (EEP) superfamily protein YafD
VASLASKVAGLPHYLEPAASLIRQPARADSHVRASGLLNRVVSSLAWLVTLSLALVVALRFFYHDGTHLLVWINAFTRYVYLPAYACLGWALWKRRRWLALANVAIVGVHIAFLAPDFMRDRRFDAVSDSAAGAPATPSVRIFFANVNASNSDHLSILQEIHDAAPDIIVLAEFSQPWYMAVRNSPVLAAYPYGNGLLPSYLETINVLSRLRLKSEKQSWIAGRAFESIEVPVGSETLQIIGLHAPRPVRIGSYDYDGYWNRMVPTLLAMEGPLVVVGDFNATQYSRVYKQLTAQRLRSAHQDRGRGYATSWPDGQFWLPPIRIDQALLSPEVECAGISEGEGRGSDHRPLILDVRVRAKN